MAQNNIDRIELLAPAGDTERLGYALNFGADAVYLGGTMFGMRAGPKNFDENELSAAVKSAHDIGVKVYLTCNTTPRNDELKVLPDFLRRAAEIGVDAFIVTDIGVLKLAKEVVPDVDIHISTQAGIVNYMSANEFYNMGAKRIVVARELSMDEIAEIRAKIPDDLEIEAFIHGAMCMSFSGRCLLSNYLTGRDANRGDCAQPCRWKYTISETKREGEYFPISEDTEGTYIMNSRDMCMIEHIPKLVEAGITSFKIEGRAKSAYYTGVVTNAYRAAIDEYKKSPTPDFMPSKWILDEMGKVSYREYCTGFYFGHPSEDAQIFYDGIYKRDWDVVGIVEDYKDGYLFAEQRNKFCEGDFLEVLQKGEPPFEIKVTNLRDSNGEAVESVPHPLMKLSFKCDKEIIKGSILRKMR